MRGQLKKLRRTLPWTCLSACLSVWRKHAARGRRLWLRMLTSRVCSQAVDRERKARKLADKDGMGGLVAHAGNLQLDRPERGAQGSRSHHHSSRQSLFS